MNELLVTKKNVTAVAPVRVMIVDDSVVTRRVLSHWINAEPDMEVAGMVSNGQDAFDRIRDIDPDVVILDIDMPVMDGITALPLLLTRKPRLAVIMASTLTRRNAEVSLFALSLGAKDYVTKPGVNDHGVTTAEFQRDLLQKIRAFCPRRRDSVRSAPGKHDAGYCPSLRRLDDEHGIAAPPLQPRGGHEFSLRPFPIAHPRALVIGASTGGPQALVTVMAQIAPVLAVAPVLVTQHMPPTFTTIFAEHLSAAAKAPAREAVDGEAVTAGTIYVAPGGRHMAVGTRDGHTVIALSDTPPINFCRPAVNPLFTSAAKVWGSAVAGLVLTGMGSDGLHGARDIVAAGGAIIAQDEASSVVWGMPGQVALAGFCSAVLPVGDIGPRLSRLFVGDRA